MMNTKLIWNAKSEKYRMTCFLHSPWMDGFEACHTVQNIIVFSQQMLICYWDLQFCISHLSTRRKAKSVRSPPTYPRHLFLLIGLPASIESGNLFACTQHRPINTTFLFIAAIHGSHTTLLLIAQRCGFLVNFAHKIGCHGNAPWGTEKLTPDRSSTAIVLPPCKLHEDQSGRCSEIIKNKTNKKSGAFYKPT